MPDLVNPMETGGETKFLIWADELCKSCLNSGSCPLMQVLREHGIMTHEGIHVSDCNLYKPDIHSSYYVMGDMDIDAIKRVNEETFLQRMDKLNEALAGLKDALHR